MSHAAHDPHHASHAAAGHGHEDHGGLAKYVYVCIALCILSSASFITVSKWWPFDQHVAWAFMMAVSCGKALLVVLFFMHVKYEASWKYVLTIPASIMAVFLALALVPDVGLRRRLYSDERNAAAAEPLPAASPAAPAEQAEH
jgi:cytochrome c oxidase subunit 4